ncbi:MAG: hypothetical protein Q9208_007617 [Pyrenodesmia sp. 3 TL-2023]
MADGTWKREGPEEMMVALDSAIQWWPREKLIACDTDHSHIAKLKRGQNGIYPDVRSAIKKALLSVGDLYTEPDGHHNIMTMHQAYGSDNPSDDPGNLARHRLMPFGSRSYGLATDPPQRDLEHHPDQGEDGNLGDSRRGTHQLQRSSASYPYKNHKVSRWQLGVEKHGIADGLLPQSSSISLESAMASVISEAHDAADNNLSSATSIGTELDGTWTRSPAGQVNRHGYEQIALAKPISTSDSNTAKVTPTNDLGNPPAIRIEQLALASHGLLAEASEAGTSNQGPQPVAPTEAPQMARDTVIRNDEQVSTPSTQEAHDVDHEVASSADTVQKSTTTGMKSTYYDDILKDAIKKGDIERTKALLAAFFDVNCKDEKRLTPLHDAATLRNEPLVKLLLKLGAHPEAKTADGDTPLHFMSHPEGSQTPLTGSLIDVLLQHRPPLEEANQDGTTPLMCAARRQEHLLATKLISCGASTRLTDKSGLTVLHHAVLWAKGPEVIALLITEGAPVDAQNLDEWTPLHYAVSNRADSIEPVYCLLQAGADKEAKTRRGFTPLHLAAQNGRASFTPLLIAATNGCATCVELLLSSGANIEAEMSYGGASLHAAVKIGNLQIVRTLVAHGANPLARSGKGPSGHTPRDMITDLDMHEEIRTVLKEAEKGWKHSGKKYSKWRWQGWHHAK